MRKLILSILLVLCLASMARADGLYYAAGAAAGCNVSTNEVGFRTQYTNGHATNALGIRCFLATADCSGTLKTAYAYTTDAGGSASVKICIYTEGDADTAPDSSDLKVGCSSAISESGGAGWKSAAMEGGTVTNTTSYWVCMFNSATEGWESVGNDSSDIWYASSDYYTSPPANLGSDITNHAAVGPYSIYVTIE